MTQSAEFVAVDWGTTNLRLRLLGEKGPPIAESSSAEGIGAVAAGRHPSVLLAALRGLLEPAGRWDAWWTSGGEIECAGMVTSSLGPYPTPYLSIPAGIGEIAAGRRVEKLGRFALHLYPGLRTGDDVMRGEEVEAVGILGQPSSPSEATLVLPGTHSKWIRWREGKITDFATVPTGDLHAGLHRATLLSRTLPPEPAAILEAADGEGAGEEAALLRAFDRGVDLARRDGPLASLFKVRALPVLEELEPDEASALLSGILIGGEVLERVRGSDVPVHVGGASRLRRLYLRAFLRLDLLAAEVPGDLADRASAEGLRLIRALGLR